MCLGVPARVIRVEGTRALVESRGWERFVDASLVHAKPGDYLTVVHGLALQVLDPVEAREALAAWETVGGAPLA